MTTKQKTIIVTGASQGIGAAIANLFLDRGYNVVGNSLNWASRINRARVDRAQDSAYFWSPTSHAHCAAALLRKTDRKGERW
jgi:NAD(P)-dependent dehydrogenase (short-subunit alcohol dehydrogenase family)